MDTTSQTTTRQSNLTSPQTKQPAPCTFLLHYILTDRGPFDYAYLIDNRQSTINPHRTLAWGTRMDETTCLFPGNGRIQRRNGGVTSGQVRKSRIHHSLMIHYMIDLDDTRIYIYIYIRMYKYVYIVTSKIRSNEVEIRVSGSGPGFEVHVSGEWDTKRYDTIRSSMPAYMHLYL